MAIAVASTSTVVGNDQDSLTITAPTGIAAGDKLVIAVAAGSLDNVITSTGFTESFSYQFNAFGVGEDGGFTVLYKTAVGADESATNYTISNTNTGRLGAAVMLRITGLNAGDPVFAFDTGAVNIPANTVDVSESFTASRPTDSIMCILATMFGDNTSAGEISFTNYSVTSGESNPSWTEVLDEDQFDTGGANNYYGAMGFAYANSTNNTDITGYGFRYQEVSSLDDSYQGIYAFFTIQEPASASGSNVLVTTDTTLFSASGTTGATGTTELLTTTTETFTASGQGRRSTTWTNETRPSTTWNNEPK